MEGGWVIIIGLTASWTSTGSLQAVHKAPSLPSPGPSTSALTIGNGVLRRSLLHHAATLHRLGASGSVIGLLHRLAGRVNVSEI